MAYFQSKDGTDIYYYDWGHGQPIILIHGWPLTSASWEHQAVYLTNQGFRVIAYDRRGFGRSDWAYSGYEYDSLANDLHLLIEELNLENVSLVGFSMGGGEVARYLSLYGSARVKKAVLISSVTPYLLKTLDNSEGIESEIFEEIVSKLTKDRPAFLKEFSEKFYGYGMINHTVSQPVLNFFQTMALTASPLATIELVKAWSTTDFRLDLQKIDIPTLIIHGTSDNTVPFEKSAQRALKLIPHASLLEYEHEPHGLNITAYKRLNNDLEHFLKT